MNRSAAVLILLAIAIVVIDSQLLPPIDEVLQQSVDTRSSRSSARLASNGATLVNNGRAVLTELDIAEPLPCKETGASVAPSAADAPFDNPEQPSDGTWQDVRFSSRSDAPACSVTSGRKKRNIYPSGGTWDTFSIPYTINRDQFTTDEIQNIEAAFDEYASYTCINFIPRTTEGSKYFRIVRDGGCWSYVGYAASEDPQPLSLSSGCAESKRTPIHEFFHLLGSWHQQSRPDRDTYITVNQANIQSGREHNFAKNAPSDSNTYSTEYSYRSVMHYGRTAFSWNGQDTITTVDSAFQNLIGTSPTFSFEDLQVIHRHYKCDVDVGECPTINPCGPNEYRDKNCDCYCKNDHINPAIPAIPCASVTTCTVANQACGCFNDPSTSCEGVPNSSCHQASNECRCDSPYVANSNGMCEMPSPSACDTLGVACDCSSDPLNACSAIPNSECDQDTDKCECMEDYYQKLVNGVQTCTATRRCNRVNRKCMCHRQGADACERISGSFCDTNTKACTCFPYYTSNGRRCQRNCSPLYISDGASVSPFTTTGLESREFSVRSGEEPAESDMFGLKANGYTLVATGTGSQTAILNVPRLTKDRTVRNIDVCIEYNIKMENAVFGIDYRLRGRAEWKSEERRIEGSSGWGTPISERISIVKPRNFKLRFRATGNPNAQSSNWKVEIDSLIVRNCDCPPPAA